MSSTCAVRTVGGRGRRPAAVGLTYGNRSYTPSCSSVFDRLHGLLLVSHKAQRIRQVLGGVEPALLNWLAHRGERVVLFEAAAGHAVDARQNDVMVFLLCKD